MQVLPFLTLGLDRVNSELHTPAVLLPRKKSLLRTEQGILRASVPRWTLWGRDKSFFGNRNTIPQISRLRPSVALKILEYFTLEKTTEAHWGSRGIALPFPKPRRQMRVGGQSHTPVALPPGKDHVPIVQETGLTPGTFWTGSANLDHTGIRSLDSSARSQSLHRLSYPTPKGLNMRRFSKALK